MADKPKRKAKNDEKTSPLVYVLAVGVVASFIVGALSYLSLVQSETIMILEETAGPVGEETTAGADDSFALMPPDERGWAYASRGRYLDAAAAFTDALELDATDDSALYGRAQAYAGVGDYSAAIADYNQLLTNAPSFSADAWASLAAAYDERYQRIGDASDLSDVVEAGEEAVRLADGDVSASTYRVLGRAYDALGEEAAALANYERYLQRAAMPDDAVLTRVEALR